MTDLGYVEGKNISYELKDFDAFLSARHDARDMELIWGQADLVFTLITEASLMAKEATRGMGIPLVFAYAGIEGADLVQSIREPGGHVTGVRYPGPEQIGKRLEILNQIAPLRQRILIVYGKDYPNTAPALAMLRPHARSLGLTLAEVPVGTLEEVANDLTARDRWPDPGVDAILMMPDIINHSPEGWNMLRAFAARHDLPIAGSFLYTVEQGAIFGNANDLAEVGRLAAPLAHKIFQGIAAGTIPVVTPEQDLFINFRRARELGLEVPEGLLRQAKKIIR